MGPLAAPATGIFWIHQEAALFLGTAKESDHGDSGVQSIGTGVVNVTPGDSFELIARQTSGSTMNVADEELTRLFAAGEAEADSNDMQSPLDLCRIGRHICHVRVRRDQAARRGAVGTDQSSGSAPRALRPVSGAVVRDRHPLTSSRLKPRRGCVMRRSPNGWRRCWRH